MTISKENWSEREVEVGNGFKIRGTMAIPNQTEGKMIPAVMIIAGSGPIDRDGNITKPNVELNLYHDLARFITSELGFATVRYDKRGIGKSEGEYISTGMYDLVNDAEKVFNYLANHPNIDNEKIIVAGHSEGTIIGTALAEKQNVGGLMLLSGGVINLEEALRGQRKLAYQELMEKPGLIGWVNRTLKVDEKNEKKVKSLNEKIKKSDKDIIKVMGFVKQPAKWMREHFEYDPREALKKFSCPVMAIHGDKDNLVDNEVLHELVDLVRGDVEYHIIENMEHGLREQLEDKSILKAKKLMKQSIGKPLHPEVKEKIASWLTKHFK